MPNPIALYKPGDRLRIYNPGETVDREHPSWSLLLFKINALDFCGIDKPIITRIQKHLQNTNIIYIGDVVTQTREDLRHNEYVVNGLGAKSIETFEKILGRAGLCLDLKLNDWPPDNLADLEKMLPEYEGQEVYYSRPRTYSYRSVAKYLEAVAA